MIRPSVQVDGSDEICDRNKVLVPLAGLEPALLAEPDFESGASTNSATGAMARIIAGVRAGSTLCILIDRACAAR
jgi:hypothetical protein